MASSYWYLDSDNYLKLTGLKDAKTLVYDNAAIVKMYLIGQDSLHSLDLDVAVDKGSGKVGLPITANTYVAGDWVRLHGTVNFDGFHLIDSKTTDEIVITATYVAETFTDTAKTYKGVPNGCDISMSYIAASDGDYDGVLPDTMLMVDGTGYDLFIDVAGASYDLVLKYNRTAVYYPNTN